MSKADSVQEYLRDQTDEEILSILGAVITDDAYEENDYTDMVKSIADKFKQYKKLTDKQRAAVCTHLSFWKKLWF